MRNSTKRTGTMKNFMTHDISALFSFDAKKTGSIMKRRERLGWNAEQTLSLFVSFHSGTPP